jgi:hypothetical protein
MRHRSFIFKSPYTHTFESGTWYGMERGAEQQFVTVFVHFIQVHKRRTVFC